MSKNKGFTLIELLVVIAIIGILASIVLASLNTARNKGKDASIEAQMASARSQAEIYYGSNGNTYGVTATAGNCTGSSAGPLFKTAASSGGLLSLIQGIAAQVNGTQSLATTEAVCNMLPATGNATSWAMAVMGVVTSPSQTFYCVDSNGTSRFYNNASTPAATALVGASGAVAIITGATTCN